MLTKKQKDLLLFIHERMKSGDIAPSFDEMREALGLKSKSGIHRLITGLVERGYLERLPHRARALEVKRLPEGHDGSQGTAKAQSGTGLSQFMQDTADHIAAMALQPIPLFGKIAAGVPIEAIRDEGQTIDVPPSLLGSGEHYALTVDGDSMVNAGIHDGDTVIIQRCDRVPDGAIAVALVDQEEVTLKTIKHRQGQILLIPENDNYETRSLTSDRVQIQGRLISLLRCY